MSPISNTLEDILKEYLRLFWYTIYFQWNENDLHDNCKKILLKIKLTQEICNNVYNILHIIHTAYNCLLQSRVSGS